MAFQPAFNARLILEVRKYPCLYNHSRRGSGDTMERQRLWESIAKNIDPNCAAEFAKKRWLQLRDRYRKELKIAIKNGFVTPVRWCYFNQLSWLDPYLKDNIGQVADEGKKTTKSDESTPSTPFGSWFGFPNLNTIKDEMMEDDECEDPALESSVLDRLLAQTAQRLDSISPEFENDESGAQSLDGIDEEISEKNDDVEEDIKEEVEDVEEEKQMVQPPPPPPPQTEAMAMLTEALNQQQQSQQKPSVESLIAANQARFAHHLAAQLSGMSSIINGTKKSESAAIPQQSGVIRSLTPPPSSSTPSGNVNANTIPTPRPQFHPYKEALRNSRHHTRQAESLMRHHLQQVGRAALEWLNDEDLLYSRIIGLKLKKMDPKKRKKVREQIMNLLDETDESGDNDDSCSSHSLSARDNDEECHVEPTENEISQVQI
uniref:MADF domain-containing protein n=1 Tax=Caenorhabditis japonica TaxID=281687 RepID=A0A8R1E473_CAEJA